MPQLHVLRVFCDQYGDFGNELGVFVDGGEVPEERRQAVAAELGFSETVFVEDAATARIRIFTPGLELPFAGHPSVGTAWLLGKEREPVTVLRPPAGEVGVRCEGGITTVTARAEWSPQWKLFEVDGPSEVEGAAGPPPGEDLAYLWAWIDEEAGTVRSRCWSLEDGVGEDEATGSAAIVLADALGRELEIEQGRGSRLAARPLGDGRAEVGGRCVLDQCRDFEL
jgi:predicted PhzF superfamily epimerase YddE/YHI9